VLCDRDGEFVHLVISKPQPRGCGPLSDYDMRVFGAQMAAAWVSLQNNSAERGAGGIVEMWLACSGGTLLCRSLRDGYYVVLLLARGTPSALAAFELRNAASQLAAEL
jgi:hypothetical protein